MKIAGIFNLYGLLIGIGIWVGYEVSRWYARRIKFDERFVDQGLLWAIIPGLIGARLYHVIDLWEVLYRQNPLQMIKVWEGGLGIWGGIIGGFIGLAYFSYLKKENFLRVLDIGAIGIPLAQAIGRWGNFFNGELYGKNGEPLFLYESLLNLLLFIILIVLATRGRVLKGISPLRFAAVEMTELRAGMIFGIYLIGYGLIRFFLEMLRPEEIVWVIGGIPTAQIMSVVAIIVGVVILRFSELKRS